MKKVALIAATVFAAWSVGAFADGVGVVDMKTVFSTSPKVKQIKDQLSKQFDPEKDKLQKMSQSLQADIAKYQKNKAVMNAKETSALEASITKQENDFRTEQAKFQQDVMDAQNKSLKDFMASVKAAVKVVAEKDKLDLVVPSNDVLYSKNNKDITAEVLKEIK